MAKSKIQYAQTIPLGTDGLSYTLPPQPPEKEIDGYRLPSAKQKFTRQEFMSVEEFNKLSKGSQTDIISSELERRLHGYWFFNNGIPTYISGSQYFYLTYWYIAALTPSGYPDYRDAQRRWFYFIDLCENDPLCFGAIMMSAKRFSKTEAGLAHIYNLATLVETDCLFGMQSLNATEAKNNLFKGRILRSHRRIPDYLKPLSNDSIGKKEITAELKFMGTKKGGAYTSGLDNIIDWRPTLVSAYQGKRPREVYWDEGGTIEEMDILEALSTVKQQLQIGKTAFGKIFLPFTLESMTPKGAPLMQQIWEESNPLKRDANGRTISWLYRYFNPHYKGREQFLDEWGNDLEEEAKTFRANELEVASPAGKTKIKRQYPETEEEAFSVVINDIWEDDVKEILKKRETYLKGVTVPTKRVIFYEEGASASYIVSNTEDIFVLLEEPQPDTKYVIGVDGSATDNRTGKEDGSKFAFTVRKGFDGYGKRNYVPVGVFAKRPEKLEYVYHQLYLAAKFYNRYGKCKVFVESNVGQGAGVLGYFDNRGAIKLIAKTPKNIGISNSKELDKYGIYRGSEVVDKQIIIANRLLRMYGNDIEIIEVIKSYLNYGKQNEDIADSDLMAMLGFADFDKAIDRKPVLNNRILWKKILYQEGMYTKEKWIQVTR